MDDFSDQQVVVKAVWSKSEDDTLLRERSHWRGVGRYTDDRAWLAIGKRTLREVRTLRRIVSAPPLAPRSLNCLEWGPGGGSNIIALAPYALNYAGVDVSSPNLVEAETQAREAGLRGFQPIHLVESPHEHLRELRYEIDLFISTAVFQHFPSKEYAADVLTAVSRVMAPKALGVVQTRFDNGNPRYVSKNVASYDKDYLTATSFAIEEFWDLLSGVGFEPLACKSIRSDINYATYLFWRPPSG